ncbi:MAG: aminotransferase class V-fold PLP-dependent enzyme [Bradymonadia bacterium]
MTDAPSPAPEAGPLDVGALRPHYSAFLTPGRVLLTGHSHQAWPDVARAGMLEAFEDAAAHVDDKWSRALACADDIRASLASNLGARPEEFALGANTHELIARCLSTLPEGRRRHLVTTDGEFHSITRQLRRLAEEGVEITWVPAQPVDTLAERLASEIRPDTGAVMVSTVLFGTGHAVPHLRACVDAAHRHGARIILDAYHAYGVRPFALSDFGPDPIYMVGGGYKYVQWGEGVCWLRTPAGCTDRPVYTGWFAEFAQLDAPRHPGEVLYGGGGAGRYAGSTYDPVSHYRARAVIRFFESQGMTPKRLQALYSRQTQRIIDGLPPQWTLLSPREASRRGGFVSVRHPKAAEVVTHLRGLGIYTDARGERLRLGPAPYILDDEIDQALAALRAPELQ